FPSPNTIVCRQRCSLHRVQSPRSSRMVSKVSPGIRSIASKREGLGGGGGSSRLGPGFEAARDGDGTTVLCETPDGGAASGRTIGAPAASEEAWTGDIGARSR